MKRQDFRTGNSKQGQSRGALTYRKIQGYLQMNLITKHFCTSPPHRPHDSAAHCLAWALPERMDSATRSAVPMGISPTTVTMMSPPGVVRCRDTATVGPNWARASVTVAPLRGSRNTEKRDRPSSYIKLLTSTLVAGSTRAVLLTSSKPGGSQSECHNWATAAPSACTLGWAWLVNRTTGLHSALGCTWLSSGGWVVFNSVNWKRSSNCPLSLSNNDFKGKPVSRSRCSSKP